MREASAHLRFPPFLLWFGAGLGWWGAAKLHALAGTATSATASLATIGTMVAAFLGGRMVLCALAHGDVRRDRRRMDQQRRDAAQTHGGARFATPRDVKAFGLTKGKGVFLGRLPRRWRRPVDLYYGGTGHVLTIGPPGSGKGTAVVVPNLVANPETTVVIDVKGELAAMTARHRRERLGHDVVLINPFHQTLSAELGITLGDDGYNPCSLIRRGNTIKDDCDLLASLLLPLPAKPDAKSEFFIDAGQQILSAGLMDIVRRGEHPTIPGLRRWLMATPQTLERQLAEMAASTEFGGVLRESGAKLLATLTNAPEEFQGGHSSAVKAVRIYDGFGPMGGHVSRGDGFSFETIKQRPTTVYIILPSDRGITHAPWMNLVLTSALELIGRDRTNKRVTFLIDELANLGYLPNLLRAMAQYRAQGVRIHGVVQQVSQIRRIYGPDGWRDLVGLCAVTQAFGVTEYETTKLLSDMSGQATVEDVHQSVRPTAEGGMSHAELSFSHSRTGQPLLHPDTIRTMDAGKMLLFIERLPPLIADKVDYRAHRQWSKLVDPNPYYERPAPEAPAR